ncbi:MAG: efflux RND transporter periplasmic adaptor subunit [Planctomycetaceae bacterium]
MKTRLVPALIFVLVTVVGGWLVWGQWNKASTDNSESAVTEGEGTDSAGGAGRVVLNQVKRERAALQFGRCEKTMLQPTRTVSGRLTYDDTRHIEVRVPTAGILSEVLVKPGDVVEQGQVLAVLDSPEVGLARADVLRRTTEETLARVELERNQAILEGLKTLVAAVEQGTEAGQILEQMDGVRLGQYREKIVSAYARFRLATQQTSNIAAAAESGAISGKIVNERISERNAAESALKGVTEESLYESQRAFAASELAAIDAERRLRIAKQHVSTLLGYEETSVDDNREVSLSRVEIRAPFSGSIETKWYSKSERVEQGDRLMVLADTTQLYVSADIREKEWNALKLEPGEPLNVTSPTFGSHYLVATLLFLGREVSPETNAVPLVATIANPDGLLRPGQFVRVTLPMARAQEVLAVPDSAIVDHGGERFVFVPEEENTFLRVNVTTGLSERGMTEVLSGLKEGDALVVQGAFVLKTELLLESEE